MNPQNLLLAYIKEPVVLKCPFFGISMKLVEMCPEFDDNFLFMGVSRKSRDIQLTVRTDHLPYGTYNRPGPIKICLFGSFVGNVTFRTMGCDIECLNYVYGQLNFHMSDEKEEAKKRYEFMSEHFDCRFKKVKFKL